MKDIFTVKIDRKNLYLKKYDNKKYKENSNQKSYVKDSLVQVFVKMIDKNIIN